MITMIAFALIGMGYNIYDTYHSYWSDLFDYVMTSICGIIFGGLIGFVVAICLPMDTYQKKYSLNLQTLQDGSSVNGHFFLGTGHFEDKMKYVFYYENNGLFKMEQLDYKIVEIRYSNNKPKVNVTQIYPTDSWINKVAIDFDAYDKTYIIDVPSGTIKNNYTLDAQ
jgi:hypothetical protein